jgi:cold shock CspA family protein
MTKQPTNRSKAKAGAVRKAQPESQYESKRTGRVRYADMVKGYGYITAVNQQGKPTLDESGKPSENLIFRTTDVDGDIEALIAGCEVEFDIALGSSDGGGGRALNVTVRGEATG